MSAELLSLGKYVHITRSTALLKRWISSSIGAPDTEILPHHSPNPSLRRQACRPHGPWQATA